MNLVHKCYFLAQKRLRFAKTKKNALLPLNKICYFCDNRHLHRLIVYILTAHEGNGGKLLFLR